MSEKIHRRIWKEAFGEIPKDESGRPYDIHHVDGNRQNNELNNLKCISMKEHYEIHLLQGEYLAAAAIARRMGMTELQRKQLNSLAGKEAYRMGKGWFDPHKLEVSRQKATAASAKITTGTKWYNNGSQNIRSKAFPGEGWVLGKLGRSGMPTGTVLGTFWNKDKMNKRSVDCPGEGWEPGKYLTEDQRKRRSQIVTATLKKRWHT